MSTDVLLDQGSDGSRVVVAARVLEIQGSDVLLDSSERRVDPTGIRRALVHDQGDGLTVNFAGDYPGGVRVTDARVQLHVESQQGEPHLPRAGVLGELLVISVGPRQGEIFATRDRQVSLWLCLGARTEVVIGEPAARWVQISTGATVTGDV